MKSARRSSSVDRAFQFITVVADSGPDGVTLSDIADQTGVAVSTVHRYATTLLDLGVLARDDSGRLRLGITLVTLAGQFLGDHWLRVVARPHLTELVRTTGETAHLGIPSGDEIVYVDKVESHKSVRLVSRIGSGVPLHSSSMGKAILAHQPPDRQAEVLARPLVARTGNTLVGEALRAELAAVRKQGFAIDDEENEEGVRCVGLPIVNSLGQPVGAFSVSAPASRLSLEACHNLAPRALAMAEEIGRAVASMAPRVTIP